MISLGWNEKNVVADTSGYLVHHVTHAQFPPYGRAVCVQKYVLECSAVVSFTCYGRYELSDPLRVVELLLLLLRFVNLLRAL